MNNLGLNAAHAKNWQCYLDYWGYRPGTIDGQLGTDSWKAAQRLFNDYGHSGSHKLVVDGIVGTNTIKALQRFLNWSGVEHLAVDGVAGPDTRAAFWRATRAC
ncbi:peptidoglycan-binding protein [Streptomyces sp. NPDC087300]|uniref:peptidoglycan-binding domain-containing protein n=1 Tax=Streptomyces sp. NPDC087300 TaxID=3365780 RepID=UPI0038182CD4